ncbi:hypothetical protein M9H77_02220 [Catharanthus roseus]|uniref:Uncharacterized protein n=1 Tax=Catharanthus roseus TaxID=4058 RepID=A0ACC0C7P7_CATRO|nr:hypothetical protein M9H77_02220 [Catharanthus roseus]
MATPSTSSSEQLFQTPENVSNNTNTMQELLNDAFGIPSEHASIDPIADLDGEMPNHEVGNFDKLANQIIFAAMAPRTRRTSRNPNMQSKIRVKREVILQSETHLEEEINVESETHLEGESNEHSRVQEARKDKPRLEVTFHEFGRHMEKTETKSFSLSDLFFLREQNFGLSNPLSRIVVPKRVSAEQLKNACVHWNTDKAKAKMKEFLSQLPPESLDPIDCDDSFSKVMGKDPNGVVRMYGLGPMSSDVFTNRPSAGKCLSMAKESEVPYYTMEEMVLAQNEKLWKSKLLKLLN